jgi:hypothetical protein
MIVMGIQFLLCCATENYLLRSQLLQISFEEEEEKFHYQAFS